MALITSAVIRLSVPREGSEDGDGRCLAGVDCEEIGTIELASPVGVISSLDLFPQHSLLAPL
jgi:hypothetical protein